MYCTYTQNESVVMFSIIRITYIQNEFISDEMLFIEVLPLEVILTANRILNLLESCTRPVDMVSHSHTVLGQYM